MNCFEALNRNYRFLRDFLNYKIEQFCAKFRIVCRFSAINLKLYQLILKVFIFGLIFMSFHELLMFLIVLLTQNQ